MNSELLIQHPSPDNPRIVVNSQNCGMVLSIGLTSVRAVTFDTNHGYMSIMTHGETLMLHSTGYGRSELADFMCEITREMQRFYGESPDVNDRVLFSEAGKLATLTNLYCKKDGE